MPENEKKKVVLGEDEFRSQDIEVSPDGVVIEHNHEEVNPEVVDEGTVNKEYEKNVRNVSMTDNYERKSSEFYDKEKRQNLGRSKNRMIVALVFLVLASLAIYFAPAIHRAIYAKENSILFVSGSGILGPRMGLLFFLASLFIIGIVIWSSITSKKSKDESLTKLSIKRRESNFKKIGLLLSVVFIVLAFASLKRYTDFTTENIINSTLIGKKVTLYDNVKKQAVSFDSKASIIYHKITLEDNSEVIYPFNTENKEKVKVLDQKYNPARNKAIDTDTFQAILRQGLYTEQEANLVYR